MTAEQMQSGRNRVGAKALRSVATVVTAEAMGVTARDVSVELTDDAGLLGVTAVTAIALPALDAPPRTSPTALERAFDAQAFVRQRMLELTGSAVGTVNLRLSTARIGTARSNTARITTPRTPRKGLR
jgi:hypothetical protein